MKTPTKIFYLSIYILSGACCVLGFVEWVDVVIRSFNL